MIDSPLYNVTPENFRNGIYMFDNGKYIFIEQIEYSSDTTFWENEFIPYEHQDPRDYTKTVKGHKWRRVRHAGDSKFQRPEYIVAEDGKNPILRVTDKLFQWKLEGEDDSKYKTLFDFSLVKGEQGERGLNGRGWHVDNAGFFSDRPLCPTTVNVWSSTCNSCNPQVNIPVNTGVYLYLSIGDGTHTIIITDIGKYRSEDGVSWVVIGSNDVGRQTTFMADDSMGANYVDYRLTNLLNTAGKVYVFYNGIWKELFNVAIPYYVLAPTATYFANTQSGFFMDSYVAESLTVVMNIVSGKYTLDVKDESIEIVKLNPNLIGDGLGVDDVAIIVDPVDFSGFGIGVFASDTDGYYNIQVRVDELISNGLAIYDDSINATDGETRYLAKVKPSDLINTLSGLKVNTELDGFDDLYVKPYRGVLVTSDGVTLDVDELSLTLLDVDLDNKLTIKKYAAGNDGVLASHLNPTVANTDKGIVLNNTTGLEVLLDSADDSLDVTNLGLKIKANGIKAVHLGDDVLDTNSGLILSHDDGLSVKLKTGGGIAKGADGLYIDTTTLFDNTCVTSLNSLTDDVVIASINSNPTSGILLSVNTVDSNVNIGLAVNANTLKTYLGIGGTPGSYITSTNVFETDTEIAQAIIDATIDKVDKDTVIGNLLISYTNTYGAPGLYLISPSGTKFRLIVDDYGQIGT